MYIYVFIYVSLEPGDQYVGLKANETKRKQLPTVSIFDIL